MSIEDFHIWFYLAGFRTLIRSVPRRIVMLKNNSRAPDALENDILTMIKSICIKMQIYIHIHTFGLLAWWRFIHWKPGKHGSNVYMSSHIMYKGPGKFYMWSISIQLWEMRGIWERQSTDNKTSMLKSFSQLSIIQGHINVVKVHQGSACTHLTKWVLVIRQLQFIANFQAQVEQKERSQDVREAKIHGALLKLDSFLPRLSIWGNPRSLMYFN